MIGIVRRRGTSEVGWHGQAAVLLGPITFALNDVRFTVDAVEPDEVVGLSASSPAALRAAAHWFADPSAVDAIASGIDGAATEGPILADALARVATVHAVAAIHLGDLDDGVLLLDQAYAYERAADSIAAQRFYALSTAIADRLVDEIAAQNYVGPLVARVRESILAAPERTFAAESRDWMLGVLDAQADAEDVVWESIRRMASETSELALDLGDAGESRTPRVLADLRLLCPRVLVFEGPDKPEVNVEIYAEAIDLSARLRSDVIAESTEVAGIFAVVADAATGDLLAHSPTQVVDGRVRATVQLAAEADTVRCAFIQSSADLSAVRLDPVGAALNRIDRHCRYAWTEHRRAGALRATIGVADEEDRISDAQHLADVVHRGAVAAVDTAIGLTRQLVRRQRKSPRAQDLAVYASALDRFARIVGNDAPTFGATGPTLAELYAETLQ